jgi:DNA end-binding protein Ku
MAGPFWKGYLKLSLVTCPVAMTPATSDGEKVRFHTLNRRTGNRVQSRFVDAVTGKPVKEDDEVKGYPKGDHDYVMLEDSELESVGLESTRTIDIDMFVPQESIGWIWYDAPHFLVPNDKVGEEAYSVIREAMRASETVGLARLVLYRRERAVMLEPRDNGILLWTLHYGDEVRDEDAYFADIARDKIDPHAQALLSSLIKKRSKEWTPKMVSDPVQKKMVDIINTKKKGVKQKKAETPPPVGDNVVDIMEALKRSLGTRPKK